jgi:hypothetical protein
MNGTTGGGWRTVAAGAWLGRLLGGPGFTAAEVRELLAASNDGARARAVRQCLARPGDWLNPPPDAFSLPWRYQPHIPRIAFWYARGESVAAIEAQLGGLVTTWAIERCLAVACTRMAVCLNRDPATYGLAR